MTLQKEKGRRRSRTDCIVYYSVYLHHIAWNYECTSAHRRLRSYIHMGGKTREDRKYVSCCSPGVVIEEVGMAILADRTGTGPGCD